MDLFLGCQNIFDEISLDSVDVAGMMNEDFYEPKSKHAITATVPP